MGNEYQLIFEKKTIQDRLQNDDRVTTNKKNKEALPSYDLLKREKSIRQ